MKRALIIVDVQNDFCEGGSLPVDGGAAVAAAIADHARAAGYDYIVATKDWHIEPGVHFAPPGTAPDYEATWPVHCTAASAGAAFHPAFDHSIVEDTFRKGQRAAAYSGFEGIDDQGLGLEAALHARAIEAVDVVGIATDYCVRATALDAARLGFRTRVLAELCAGVAAPSTERAIDEMRAAGVEIAR